MLARHSSLFCARALISISILLGQAFATQPNDLDRCSIDGTVVLETENRPAHGVVVAARSLPAGPSVTVLTDDDGSFHFDGLAPGTYDIFAAESGGYESLHVTAHVDKGAQALRLSLKPHAASSVLVTGSSVSVHELRIPAKARAAFEDGWRHLHKYQAEKSLSRFRDAVRLFPDFYEAYYSMGVANLSLNRFADATQALQKAIDLSNDQYSLADFGLGIALWRTGKFAEAEAVLRNALDADPSFATGHIYLSAVLYDEDRLVEAEKSARAAILRDPDLPIVYLLLARLYARWGDSPAQLQSLEKYLSFGPDDPQHAMRDLCTAVKARRFSAETAPPL